MGVLQSQKLWIHLMCTTQMVITTILRYQILTLSCSVHSTTTHTVCMQGDHYCDGSQPTSPWGTNMVFCNGNQYDSLCLTVNFFDYISCLNCKYDDALEVPYFAPDDLNSGPYFFLSPPIHDFCPGRNNQH